MTPEKFIVALHDGTIYEVTKEAADQIFEVSTKGDKKFIRIQDKMISISSISQITEAENYYQQHPGKKIKNPKQTHTNFTRIPSPQPSSYSKERQKKKRKNRLEKMKKGFLKGVSDPNNMTKAQKTMYDNMEHALGQLEKGESPFIMGQDNK